MQIHSLSETTHSTLAASTLIILFSETMKFYFEIFRKEFFFEGKYWIFKDILFVEMKSSKLINYSTYMCGSWQCITNTNYLGKLIVTLGLDKGCEL
jgi:hypothetical protein